MPFTLGGDYIPNEKPRPKGPYKVRKERRKHTTITKIVSLPLHDDEIKELAKTLRRAFACGGSVKDGAIELQGDFTDRVDSHIKKYIARC